MQRNALITPGGNYLGGRPDWMPDPGVYKYVVDMLEDRFQLDTKNFPDYWIPLSILGTMDWVVICGWWIWLYTGFFQSDEPYHFIFDYDGYEFDPDRLLMFKENPENNKFEERYYRPGITPDERSEAIQFLVGVYRRYGKEPPPAQVMEVMLYSVFMWVLSDYGRDWFYSIDPIFACVEDFGVAYYCRWDNALLDPRLMICTMREMNTCRYCNSKTWCVSSYFIDMKWQYICNECAVRLFESKEHEMDERDMRLVEPHCPHRGGGCISSECPHTTVTKEFVWEHLKEHGRARVAAYEEEVAKLGGQSPRQIAGQTVDDVIDYFKKS